MNRKKGVVRATGLAAVAAAFLLTGIPGMFTNEGNAGELSLNEGQRDDDMMEMGNPMSHPVMPGHGMGMPGTPGGHPDMASYYWEELKLDDKQKEQMHKLYTEYTKEMVRRGADIRIAEMDLADLLEEKKVDMAAVDKAVKKIEGLRSDLMLYRVKAMMKTRDFLTEEQFEKYRSQTLHYLRHSRSWMGMHGEKDKMMPGNPPMGPGMMHP